MIKKLVARSRFLNWNRALSVLLVVLLIVLLMETACSFDGPERTGAADLDINGAVHGTTTESVSTGTTANQLPRMGSDPVALCSVNWD